MNWEVHTGRWQSHRPTRIDVCLTDPPYDARTHAAGARALGGGVDHSALDFPPLSDGERRELIACAFEAGAKWIIAFCAIEQLGAWAQDRAPSLPFGA